MSEAWKRVSGWSEGGGGDELPTFGNKARKWFRRKLRAKLGSFKVPGDEIEPVLDCLASDPMPYVEWEDDDSYRGRGYSNGSWSIDWGAVRLGCEAALKDLRSETERTRFSTLDDWLRADVEGKLPPSSARGGSAKLPKKLRRELLAAARARRKHRPRICRVCKSEFMPTCNRALRCPTCRGSADATTQGTARSADERQS